MNTETKRTTRVAAAIAIAAMASATVGPTPANADAQGYIPAEIGVGYFYGTFGESPNTVLMVGGTAEDFCRDNPDDPFNAEPGSAPLRVFLRNNGTTDLHVNDKDQPIHLYESVGEAPDFIAEACAALFDDDPATTVPAPYASGTADLKVRISLISEDLIDVYNGVNGTVASNDGTRYKVRGSADLIVEGGVPQGDPADFVKLSVTEIRRGS